MRYAIFIFGMGVMLFVAWSLFSFYSSPSPSMVPTTSPVHVPSRVPVTGTVSLQYSLYPIHRDITATVFWVGEPVGDGSSEDNAFSAWDDAWKEHFGGVDDPFQRKGFYPVGIIPKENPFYLDLPYSDFDEHGERKPDASHVIPWAKDRAWGPRESMMKNRWVKIMQGEYACYGQIEDAGPYEYDDAAYVFGGASPKNILANHAGMDVSPALRDCLHFVGVNNDQNKVNWQFVEEKDVPAGPWRAIITRSHIYWRS